MKSRTIKTATLGFFPSRKCARMVAFGSPLERDFLLHLESDSAVASYESCRVTITYADGTIRRRYVPDYLVRNADGSVALVDVTGTANMASMSTAARKRARAGWSAVRKYCARRKWTFRVVTEKDVAALGPGRRCLLPHTPVDAWRRSALKAAGKNRCLTLDQLLGSIDAASARAVVEHLLEFGVLDSAQAA